METNELDHIYKQVDKQFGKGIYRAAEEFLGRNKQIIPVSPIIDLHLGKGIAEGGIVLFSGLQGCGKTTTSLYFAANAQQPENGGRNVHYLNVEGRLKNRDLDSIPHLDRSKFHVIGSTPAEKDKSGKIKKPAKILNSNDFLGIAELILRDDPGCVLIVDSESMLLTPGEAEADIGDFQRAEGAKLMAKWCRRNGTLIDVNNNIVIIIRHVMQNQKPQGTQYVEKGGMATAFQANTHMISTYYKPWFEGNNPKPVGQEIYWKVHKTELSGGIPGNKFVSFLRYGIGIDEVQELIHLGTELGFINKAGAWFTLPFMEGYDKEEGTAFAETKTQGQANLGKLMRDNPIIGKILREQIMGLL